MDHTTPQADIPTLARRRANELRNQALADAWSWLWQRLRPRRHAAAATPPGAAPCRS